MNRIELKFNELRRRKKKAFIAFITAGYPNLGVTKRLILELSKIGIDIIELGVPFSDPMADGPIIQEASCVALKKNVHLVDILALVKQVRKVTQTPICLMTYYNPIFCFGEQKFINKAYANGVDGLILPDLPPEEGKDFIRAANKKGIDVISFISPTTTSKRMRLISRISRGFIYYVSLTGVTGPRRSLSSDIKNNIRLIKKYTKKPVCVGFGVSSSSQVKEIYRIADGVIVGSAIVGMIKKNIGSPNLVNKVITFVKKLKT